MSVAEIVTSKLTERNQTTVPPSVRTVLGLGQGERVGYVIEGDEVRLVNASRMEHEDPLIDGFLKFIARDIETNPGKLAALPPSLIAKARKLTQGIEVDHAASLDDLAPIF